MKMTLIDCAIVFAVTNVMLAGMFNQAPDEDYYMDPPVCSPEGSPTANTDPRCVTPKEFKPLSAPAQTPLESNPPLRGQGR